MASYPVSICAQDVENIDEAFENARELAFSGEREKAREIAYAILEQVPNYHDVRILVARTYAWSDEHDKARQELTYVFERQPDHKDALLAAIDNESWAGNNEAALKYSRRAMQYYSIDAEILLKRAEVLIATEKDKEAMQVLNHLEKVDQTNAEAKKLRQSIKTSKQDYTLKAAHTYDTHEKVYEDIHNSFLELSRRTGFGPIIGRINYQNRFSDNGFQGELEIYPSIAEGWHGYASVGLSSSSLFPSFRSGAELFHNISRAFEISAGFRYLNFNNDVWIYTGTISKYWGNWLFTVRPQITPDTRGVSRSFSFLARRYLSSPENYITLRGGFGFYPEERRFQNVLGDVFFAQSQFLGVDGQIRLWENVTGIFSIDATRQELTFDPDNFNYVLSMEGGFLINF